VEHDLEQRQTSEILRQAARLSYAFGPFVLDVANRRLLRDGAPVAITARVFDVLVVLVRDHGQPVDKGTLIERVWGDLAVEEGNLARNVSTLRRLLGEAPDDHRFVVTLSGRGYQFVAPVRVIGAPDADEGVAPQPEVESSQGHVFERGARTPRRWIVVRWVAGTLAAAALLALVVGHVPAPLGQRPAASAAAPARVVVLPFKNLGPADQEYVAAGITEEITSRLAVVDAMRVVSRTTASRYERLGKTVRDIGADLGTDYLLEGSILWDRQAGVGARVRIAVQLIRVADDTHVWAETFDRGTADLFKMQAEIATRVVRELRSSVLADEQVAIETQPTRSLDAYRAYLQGRFHATRPDLSDEGMAQLIRYFQRAVDLDPNFALAHAALARAQARYFRFGYDVSRERRELARRAVARAQQLAPRLPEVHLAQSDYWLTIGRDPAKALAAAETARQLRPDDVAIQTASANVMLGTGRWHEAALRLERARQVDSRDAFVPAYLSLVFVGLRRYPEAQHTIERSLVLESDQLLAYILQVWNTWLWKGDVTAARALIDRLPAVDDWRFMELRFLQALYEHRFAEALRVVAPWSGKWTRTAILARPVVLYEAQAWRLHGNRRRAAAAFEAARRLLDAEVRTTPEDGRLRSGLAIALAGLGRRQGAAREAQRALQLMPHPQAFDTTVVREDVALALTMIGEHDAALDQIEVLLAAPAHFSVQLLRLDPRWDPLRGEPKYRTLIARSDPGS
jgi:TolB-like protein/DNA-binding winged helix-turn-helix (wHTH) protein/Flp pilus assembly protein TadD